MSVYLIWATQHILVSQIETVPQKVFALSSITTQHMLYANSNHPLVYYWGKRECGELYFLPHMLQLPVTVVLAWTIELKEDLHPQWKGAEIITSQSFYLKKCKSSWNVRNSPNLENLLCQIYVRFMIHSSFMNNNQWRLSLRRYMWFVLFIVTLLALGLVRTLYMYIVNVFKLIAMVFILFIELRRKYPFTAFYWVSLGTISHSPN